KTTSLDLLIDKGFEPKDHRSDRSLDNTVDARSFALLIEKLPETYREVIRMRYLNEMSLKEISVVTKQSPNNVAVRVHRGLGMLKKLLVTPHTSTMTNKGTDIAQEGFSVFGVPNEYREFIHSS
ncbi:MAG TPA: sigma factor-like helix-turn-helix DNA-binding protein, partial [Candidatus Paceibacterota bacterium]